MAINSINEHRHFSRIPFESKAYINSQQGVSHHNCAVIDISLKGILIHKPEAWSGKIADAYTVYLQLEQGQLVITMETTVAHIDQDSIGFNCIHIDLDSITHLKRLVELNLGDEQVLQRELAALIH